MFIEIHLLLLGLTTLAALIVLALDRGQANRRLFTMLLGAVPVLFIGLVTQLLLMAGNKPQLEWMIPFAGVLLIGWRCGDRVFEIARVVAPAMAVMLAIHFIAVAHSEGITNAPNFELQLSRQRASATLNEAREQLPTEPGPMGEIKLTRIHPEWHSVVSGLYRREDVRGTVWYTGEDVEVRTEE